MIKIIKKLLGSDYPAEPIWTEDSDGEVRESKLIRCKDGTVLVWRVCHWIRANADGTFPTKHYSVRWWAR